MISSVLCNSIVYTHFFLWKKSIHYCLHLIHYRHSFCFYICLPSLSFPRLSTILFSPSRGVQHWRFHQLIKMCSLGDRSVCVVTGWIYVVLSARYSRITIFCILWPLLCTIISNYIADIVSVCVCACVRACVRAFAWNWGLSREHPCACLCRVHCDSYCPCYYTICFVKNKNKTKNRQLRDTSIFATV